MAANQLRFNVGDAQSTRKTIESKAKEIEATMKEVKASMDSVSSWWKGDAVKKFTEQYNAISGDVQKLIQSVNTIGTQLEAQAKAQQEEDGEIASKLGIK